MKKGHKISEDKAHRTVLLCVSIMLRMNFNRLYSNINFQMLVSYSKLEYIYFNTNELES